MTYRLHVLIGLLFIVQTLIAVNTTAVLVNTWVAGDACQGFNRLACGFAWGALLFLYHVKGYKP